MKIRQLTTALTACFLGLSAYFISTPTPVKAEAYWPSMPNIEAESAIVMEINTGTVLYEKNSRDTHYPASITKILTTLLAIENSSLDETVVFSYDAVFGGNEGDTSHIARDWKEELTMEQVLYAVMLESANECAYALAEHIGEKLGGDYRTFIDLMNKRAKELGCVNTHFNNCNGLPDENHYVCAYDMALISAEAYKHDQRDYNQRHNQHASYQNSNQLAVVDKDGHTVFRYSTEHETHDTERSTSDDPSYHL